MRIMKSKFLNDVILIIILVSVSLVLWFATVSGENGKTGEKVTITAGGETIGEYSLGTDASIDVRGLLTVVIKSGQVRVTGETCRNHICAKHRPISKAGQSIVCLPNGIIVKITGDGELDAVI